jgi:hypothetical protein
MNVNKRLVDFLNKLVRDPDKLDKFNNDPDGRKGIVDDADLSPEDKAALMSENSGDILRRLGETKDVTWVVAPGIKKSNIAFGIKAFFKFLAIKGLGVKGSRARSTGARKTKRSAKTQRGRKKSKK